MDKKKEKFSGYLMAGCACTFAFFGGGIVGAYSAFMPSISAEMGVPVTTLSFSTTFMAVSTIIAGMFLAPKAFKTIGPRMCMLISAVCVVCSNLIMSFSTSPWHVYISCGILCGLMMGMGNQSCMGAVIANWFYEDRAKVTGMFMAIATFGATFYITLSGILLDYISYHTIYRIYAVIAAVISAIVILIMRDKPEQLGQKAKGYEQMQKDMEAAAIMGEAPGLPGLTAAQTKKTASFWLQYIAILFCGIALFSCSTFIVTLYVTVGGLANSAAAMISSFASIVSAIVMATNPAIRKKLGSIPYYVVSAVLTVAGMCMHAMFASTASSHYWLCFVAAALMIFGGIRGTLDAQNSAAEMFGMRDFAANQAFLLTGVQAGNLFMAALYSMLIGGGLTIAQCYYVYAGLFIIGSALYIAAHMMMTVKKKV